MRLIHVSPLLFAVIGTAIAADGAGGDRIPWLSADTPPRMLPPIPDGGLPDGNVPSHWSRKGVIGVFFSNATTTNADESRDVTIAGTTSSSGSTSPTDTTSTASKS